MTTEHLLKLSKEPLPEKEQAKALIEALQQEIRHHNHLYYIEEQPIISDFDYDQLFHFLQKLEATYPELITPDSPTQRLNISTDSTFEAVEHLAPLLSLDNTYNAQELLDYAKRTERMLQEQGYTGTLDYIAELKLDGLSIALVYEHDQLVRAATRGNGTVGENVTANIRTIGSIPLHAPFSKYGITKIEIRGEVIMTHKAFTALNEQRAADGEALFANPRNAASGSLRQLDPKVTQKRRLDAFFYNINYLEGEQKLRSQVDAYELLRDCGLKVNTLWKQVHTIDEVISYCAEIEAKRSALPYEIDGMVIKVNNMAARETLGMTLHHPRSDIAYKFPAQEAITKLLDITVQVGRTGILTPVAELEPIELAGVTVKRATLHNEEDLKKKGIHIGDFVVVKRAGDVIPEVIKPVLERRGSDTQPFSMPTQCPVCAAHIEHMELTAKDQELHTLQQQSQQGACSAQITAVISQMDIPGFGLQAAKGIAASYSSLEEFLHDTTDDYVRKGLSNKRAAQLGDYIMTHSIGVTEAKQMVANFEELIIIPHSYCPNLSCPAQIKGRLEQFVSKHALDIEGLGTKLISSFVDQGLIHTFADIYTLKDHQVKLQELLYADSSKVSNQKLLTNLLHNIEASKTQPLHRLILGLNINNVGRKTAKTLEQHIDSIWDLVESSPEQLASLPDIGTITAHSIADYLQAPENITMLRALEAAGVNLRAPKKPASQSTWEYAGKKFIFTGELETMSRDEAQAAVEERGGLAVSSISKKTDFCVVGANAGSKADKAVALGVPVLTEQEFLTMLG